MASDADDDQKAKNHKTKSSKNYVFLHGELDIWVKEARSLPNMDLASERLRKCFDMFRTFGFGKKIKDVTKISSKRHPVITSDPYVSVCLKGATLVQTRVITNCENPNWDEHFFVPVAHPAVEVKFQVKDNDVLGAQLIGVVEIPADRIKSGDLIDGWFPIVGSHGNPLKPYPELNLSIQYKPVENNSLYKDGVGKGPDYSGVPKTYFPLRKGGTVTLYQDAHLPDGMIPDIFLDDGKVFKQNKCWEDICHAIADAHHFIYIIGRSVYHLVKLVREPTRPLPSVGELCLGDLLKYKSEEAVRVILLVWDDKTSHDRFLIKTEGVMQTHDEETKKFFKHSSVHCVICPRYASSKLSIFKQQVVGTLFTHHQKCVILDSEATGDKRQLTAFVGGLDLCDGRYDTPGHRIFRDLDTVFSTDIHNPTFPFEPEWLNLLEDIYKKPVIPAGMLFHTAGEDGLNEKWEEIKAWLDKREKGSLVYVAFGSETKPSQSELTQIALGLEKYGLPFFWVLKKQLEFADTEFNELPQGFEDRTKDRGLICTTWVPQMKILSHDSVGSLLSHSGSSSMVEAVQFGKALIVLPFLGDQGLVASLFEGKNMAYSIPMNESDGAFTSDSVAESVKLVMVEENGKVYRDKVNEMKGVFGDKNMQDSYINNLLSYLEK